MRLALYARVSDKKQADNYSTESQLADMQRYATTHNHTVVASLHDVGSAFRDGLERSQLKRVLEMARQHEIDALIFFSTDRFTRDIGDGVLLRRELYKLGVKLICFHPYPHEVTSEGELMNILEDWKSAQYVERLRESSMRGYRTKAQEGTYSATLAPYGYQRIGVKREAHIEIVEEHAAVVRNIFQWFVHDGLGTVQIARRLTEERIPSPGDVKQVKRLRVPFYWSQPVIYKMLRHEVYAGVWYAFRFQKMSKRAVVKRPREEWIAIDVPAIVDRATWEAAQVKLSSREYLRNAKHDYLMGQRITCHCGYACTGMSSISGDKTTTNCYYRCSGHYHARGKCAMPYFRVDCVDVEVWDWICGLVENPAHMLQSYQDAQKLLTQSTDTQRSQIEILDEQIETHRNELQDMRQQRKATQSTTLRILLDADIERHALIIDELESRRAGLSASLSTQQLSTHEVESAMVLIERIQAAAGRVRSITDFAVRRELVQALDIRATTLLEADGTKALDIHWCLMKYRVPLNKPTAGGMLDNSNHVLTWRVALREN